MVDKKYRNKENTTTSSESASEAAKIGSGASAAPDNELWQLVSALSADEKDALLVLLRRNQRG